jgi:hypothetical protein
MLMQCDFGWRISHARFAGSELESLAKIFIKRCFSKPNSYPHVRLVKATFDKMVRSKEIHSSDPGSSVCGLVAQATLCFLNFQAGSKRPQHTTILHDSREGCDGMNDRYLSFAEQNPTPFMAHRSSVKQRLSPQKW